MFLRFVLVQIVLCSHTLKASCNLYQMIVSQVWVHVRWEFTRRGRGLLRWGVPGRTQGWGSQGRRQRYVDSTRSPQLATSRGLKLTDLLLGRTNGFVGVHRQAHLAEVLLHRRLFIPRSFYLRTKRKENFAESLHQRKTRLESESSFLRCGESKHQAHLDKKMARNAAPSNISEVFFFFFRWPLKGFFPVEHIVQTLSPYHFVLPVKIRSIFSPEMQWQGDKKLEYWYPTKWRPQLKELHSSRWDSSLVSRAKHFQGAKSCQVWVLILLLSQICNFLKARHLDLCSFEYRHQLWLKWCTLTWKFFFRGGV